MIRSRVGLCLGVLAVFLLIGGCVAVEPPTGDDPDPEALFESAYTYDERLEDVRGVRTTETAAGEETLTHRVEVHERPFVDYRSTVLESTDEAREGDVYVSNASTTWWYDASANAASYFEPDDPFENEEVRTARAEQVDQQRDLVTLEYGGTETVADRETHVLEIETREEAVADGIGVLVGDVEYVYALETVDPAEELVIAEARLWLDAEYGFPLKEQVVFDVPGEEPYRYTERFEEVSFNDGLSDERFAFEPPENATVEEW